MSVIAAVLVGLAIGLVLSWYFIWQWEELSLGKKIYQWRMPPLMYIGRACDESIYYDGKDCLWSQMRGMWVKLKTLDENYNEELLHLKGAYTYGTDWGRAWRRYRKENAAKTIDAAKQYRDKNPRKYCWHRELIRNVNYDPYSQMICDMFLWLRNMRKGITDKVREYISYSEI